MGLTSENNKFSQLSPLEILILEGICKGYSNSEIGEKLNFSMITARNYVNKIIATLEVKNRTELAVKYTRYKMSKS